MANEYFSDLNYTLSNEDTRIEYSLMPANAQRVFSIAGSGARCLPLIAKNPKFLDVVDLSVAQLYLVELRLAAVKSLSYEEYLFFMGYRGALQSGNDLGNSRWDIFLKLNLRKETLDYWTERRSGWEPKGFILLGRWEAHFQKLGYLFREVLKCDFSKIFEAQSLSEQQDLYDRYWPKIRWSTFLRVAASEYVFNKFLYKGHFSGGSEKTEERPPWKMVIEEFERLFRTQLVRKNYFMQILFLGKIAYEEGLPFEAHESVFYEVKKSETQINYIQGNMLETLAQNSYEFISLSDTISYLDQKSANQILQNLNKEVPSKSTMVIRSFMKAPTKIDTTGWQELTEQNEIAHTNDGTGVYKFHIFQKN